MNQITKEDLLLINNLSQLEYKDNRLLSKACESEKEQLNAIKKKLKDISFYFSEKYSKSYGPFNTSVVTGNDIAIGGTKLKRIWAGLFKGGENKQYSAQISFVLNPKDTCLDVGFYFGRAQGHSKNKEEKQQLEKELQNLGIKLLNTINKNAVFRQKYQDLFEFGFHAYSNEKNVTSEEWLNLIKKNTKHSQIIAHIFPNEFNIIDNSTIDSYISQIIFLMGGINNNSTPIIKPLTPGQRAKQAERQAEIGIKGELFVLNFEKEKLKELGIKSNKYPKHVATESTLYGFDILSLNEDKKEIKIEVKTTTRKKEDPNSRKFFISSNEFKAFNKNENSYKLYRVYDIENNPSFDIIDLKSTKKEADGYICNY